MKSRDDKMLTEAELELMSILWKLKEGTVNDVIERLPKGRELAYTTVSTIMRILEQKKVLKARKEGRGHVYVPVVQKEDYEAKALKHVVERVFDGTPAALVRQLLSSENLSREDILELKSLVNRLGDESNG